MVPPDPAAVSLAIACGILGAVVFSAVCLLVLLVRKVRGK